MRYRLAFLFCLVPLWVTAQDLPAPGEGAFTWDTLGVERTDAEELVFTESGELLAFGSDMSHYHPESGTWLEVNLPNLVGTPNAALVLGGDTLITGDVLSRSIDGGLSWEFPCRDANGDRTCERLHVKKSHAIYEIPRGPHAGRLLAGGSLYSDDRGASWQNATIDAVETNWSLHMHDFAALPSGRVIGAGEWGAGISPDGGETWAPSSLFGPYSILGRAIEAFATPGSVQAHDAGGPPPSCGLADVSLCEGAVLIGTHGAEHARAWWTNDGGRTWTEGSLLPQIYDGPGWSHVAMLSELDRMGTASDGSGGAGRGLAILARGFVFATIDGGVTWTPVARQPLYGDRGEVRMYSSEIGPDGRIYASTLRIDPDGEYVYVTNEQASAAFDYLAVADEAAPETGAVGVSVRPNPAARGRVTVELRQASPSADVRAEVYDAVGRRVAVLHEGAAGAELSLSVDTSRWAPGVYVVRAVGGGAVASASFTVVR